MISSLMASMIVILAAAPTEDHMAVVRERFTTHLLQQIDASKAGEHLATLREDGSWEDVNYNDRSRAGWSPAQHLSRLEVMAAAYNHPDSKHHQSKAMLDGVGRGLLFWDKTAPYSANPFERRIGTPIRLGHILVIMHGRIDPALRDRIVTEKMSDVIVEGGYSRRAGNDGHRESGPDVVRGAYVHICVGLLTDDAEAITIASRHIQAEARIAKPGEGLQPDGSYQYHGRQIYFPGYWQAHFEQVSLWGELFAELPWAFETDSKAFLHEGILNGARWMIRGKFYDPFVMGRGLARPTEQYTRLSWLERMTRIDPTHAPEYRAILDHIAGKADAPAVGNRHFWLSDYMVHSRTSYRLSVRMHSSRTSGQEAGNDENTQNRYLSQGATAIMVDGDEYERIFPVWDWRRIPGTTTAYTTGRRGVMQAGNWGVSGYTEFTGAASNGSVGVAAMDVDWHDGDPEGGRGPSHKLDPGRIYVHKNWFFFDREMVALGSGIRYTGQFAPVQTTVNQMLRKTPIFSNIHPAGTGEPDTEGRSDDSLQWLWHGQVGYLFPTQQHVVLRNESQLTGSWRSINRSYDEELTETKDRVTISLDHGDKPDGESYAYVAVPGLSRQDFDTYRGKDHVTILSNTPHVAAVHHKGQRLTGIVFRDPASVGRLKVHDKLTMAVDAPVILLVDESVTPTRVTASCPTASAVKVTLITPEGEQVLAFDMPGTRSRTLPETETP